MTTLVDSEDPALAALFSPSRRIMVLTGAGVSVASGLPTYHGAGGLYADTDLKALHHAASLPGSLGALWAFYGPLRELLTTVQPNAAHRAIAAWQAVALQRSRGFTLVTQNVDDLHERASSPQVAHLHGSLFTACCMDPQCACGVRPDRANHAAAPQWPVWGGLLRPAMVLFGERLFAAAELVACRAVRDCDLFVAVGTSTAVSTALFFLEYAFETGAATVCINPAPEVNERFSLHVPEPAEEALDNFAGHRADGSMADRGA
jgi:NAD-dependent deacetylase